jgi:hypothetical protein
MIALTSTWCLPAGFSRLHRAEIGHAFPVIIQSRRAGKRQTARHSSLVEAHQGASGGLAAQPRPAYRDGRAGRWQTGSRDAVQAQNGREKAACGPSGTCQIILAAVSAEDAPGIAGSPGRGPMTGIAQKPGIRPALRSLRGLDLSAQGDLSAPAFSRCIRQRLAGGDVGAPRAFTWRKPPRGSDLLRDISSAGLSPRCPVPAASAAHLGRYLSRPADGLRATPPDSLPRSVRMGEIPRRKSARRAGNGREVMAGGQGGIHRIALAAAAGFLNGERQAK